MLRRLSLALVIVLAVCAVAQTGERPGKAIDLPELDGQSGKGLKIECRLTKAQFEIGEPVNIWCTVTNTTDSTKPIGWHSNVGLHFCCVPAGKATREGLLPRAYPQIRSPIMIQSKAMQPGYILYLPPKESLRILLTHKAERPVTFKGRIVYDPVAPRGGGWAVTKDEGPPWKDEWVYSNEFEYEVIPDGNE